MAEERVGGLHVQIDGSSQKLGAELTKANAAINEFGKKARKSLEEGDGGFLDKLAAKAKNIRSESRKSGEGALRSFAEGGASGLLDFGLESVGAGLVGVMVEKLGETELSLTKGLTEGLENFRSGRKGWGELTADVADKVPVLGAFFKETWAAGDLIGSLLGNEDFVAPDTREKRARAFFTANRGADISLNDSRLDMLAAQEENPYARQRFGLEKQYTHAEDKLDADRLANSQSFLTEGEKDVMARKIFQVYLNELHEIDAKGVELAEREGARKMTSLLQIDEQIAASRLTVETANAHSVAEVWKATEDSIALGLKVHLDAIDQRLANDKSLTGEERIGLGHEREAAIQGAAAEGDRKHADLLRGERLYRNQASIGMLGGLSSILSGYEQLPGGETIEAQRGQRLLSARIESLSLGQAFDQYLDKDSKASDEQKAVARQGLGLVDSLYGARTSDAALNFQPYLPLRLPGAEMVNGSYGGAADYAQAQDQDEYARNQDFGAGLERTNAILTQILGLQQELVDEVKSSQGTPLWQDGGG